MWAVHMPASIATVSYTHLDVYKRQGLYTHAKLQWVPVAAFGYPYAGVSVRSDGACDRRDTDPHDRHGLLGQFGA